MITCNANATDNDAYLTPTQLPTTRQDCHPPGNSAISHRSPRRGTPHCPSHLRSTQPSSPNLWCHAAKESHSCPDRPRSPAVTLGVEAWQQLCQSLVTTCTLRHSNQKGSLPKWRSVTFCEALPLHRLIATDQNKRAAAKTTQQV